MKKLELFYLPTCPHCQLAFSIIDELKKEDRYRDVEIEQHNERSEQEYADAHDYWYVPCFYIDGVKVAEGHLEKEDIQAVFEKYLAE